MARSLAKSPAPANAWSDIPSLLMLGTGTLLYLALISYTPSQLPPWVPFGPGYTREVSANFIGPVGAIVAGLHFFFFGAASFLIAVLLLGFGAVKLFVPNVRVQRRVVWIVLFVVCGAGLAQLQPQLLHGLNANLKAHGPGGLFGQWLVGTPKREGMLPMLLGPVGSTLVLGLAYLCTLILITGLHPITQLNRGIHAARTGFAAWRERRAADKLASASDQERLDMDRVRLAKEQRRLEKQLRQTGRRSAAGH